MLNPSKVALDLSKNLENDRKFKKIRISKKCTHLNLKHSIKSSQAQNYKSTILVLELRSLPAFLVPFSSFTSFKLSDLVI